MNLSEITVMCMHFDIAPLGRFALLGYSRQLGIVVAFYSITIVDAINVLTFVSMVIFVFVI